MARKRRTGATDPVGRARAGLTRGVDPADRIVRWIGASGRKRARIVPAAEPAAVPRSCDVIRLSWAQTFGRPEKGQSIASPITLRAAYPDGSASADLRGR